MFFAKNKLRILKKIGEGLNASVYKVAKWQPDLKTEHYFALKVLKRSSDLKLFKLEFENLLKAEGRHLVRYRGWERYKSKPALLLELIDGVTLYELTKAFTLSSKEVSWIKKEVFSGLLELKNCGLTHGDLSTKNIMISNDGTIKLIDFGLSHWSTKRIELTPEFADPKVISGARPEFESDLFSLNKIIESISTSLEKNNPHEANEAPISLISKVNSLTSNDIETKAFSNKKPKQNHIKKPRVYKAPQIALLASFFFLTPVSAHNSLEKISEYKIRSKNWLQVGTSKGQYSCFTPCALELKEHHLQSIYWKSEHKSGKINVYTDNSKKVINLSL